MDGTAQHLADQIRNRPRTINLWATVTAVSSDLVTVSFADGGSATVRATGKLPSVAGVVQIEFRAGAMRIVGTSGGFA